MLLFDQIRKLAAQLLNQRMRTLFLLYFGWMLFTWPIMALFEWRANPDIVKAYWYFYDVAGKTIGFGDLSPKTFGGRLTYFVTTSISLPIFALILTKVGVAFIEYRRKMRMGTQQLDLTKHFVIAGYTPDYTEQLVEQLRSANTRIVVCAPSDQLQEDPFPDTWSDVHFVSGDLGLADPYLRACLDAKHAPLAVIINGNDDLVTQSWLLAVRHVNTAVHVVAVLRDMRNAPKLQMVSQHDHEIECVDADPGVAARSARYPGIGEAMSEIAYTGGAIHGDDGNAYLMTLPPELLNTLTVREIVVWLMERGAGCFGFQETVDGDRRRVFTWSPDTILRSGMGVFYVRPTELTERPW